METPSATLEKKPLPLPSDLYIEEDGSAQTTKFRKMLRDSFLSESDSSNSNSPCRKQYLIMYESYSLLCHSQENAKAFRCLSKPHRFHKGRFNR